MPATIFVLRHEIIQHSKELEGQQYLSYGLTAKLTDKDHEVVETVEDITSKEDFAHSLLQQAISYNVTPLCLKMFIDNFITDTY